MRFFRIYYEVQGSHTHTRWFSVANSEAVLGKCGELTFVNDEWESLMSFLKHSRWIELHEVRKRDDPT